MGCDGNCGSAEQPIEHYFPEDQAKIKKYDLGRKICGGLVATGILCLTASLPLKLNCLPVEPGIVKIHSKAISSLTRLENKKGGRLDRLLNLPYINGDVRELQLFCNNNLPIEMSKLEKAIESVKEDVLYIEKRNIEYSRYVEKEKKVNHYFRKMLLGGLWTIFTSAFGYKLCLDKKNKFRKKDQAKNPCKIWPFVEEHDNIYKVKLEKNLDETKN